MGKIEAGPGQTIVEGSSGASYVNVKVEDENLGEADHLVGEAEEAEVVEAEPQQ